ncbi:MAG TPA: DUF4173 domain-containing protein [Flavobacteriales bacterium]|nr:DUF4173 domain-containing protein [Flavobacteriales bacterium]
MKNKIILILLSTAAWSYLFYRQTPGINHAVFSVVLVLAFALGNIQLLKNKTWLLAAVTCLGSGLLTAINGGELNLLINVWCFLIMAFVSFQHRLSLITGCFFAGISSISSFLITPFSKLVNHAPQNTVDNTANERKLKWYHMLIPVFFIFIFFILYRESSSAFKNLTNFIDLSFISSEWFFFTFAGFIFLFGLFVPPAEFNFLLKETSFSNHEIPVHTWKTNGFLRTGLMLFISLDLLLAIVNVSDVVYLSCIDIKAMDMTYAELIHQGIGSLAFSLILAVGFILLWINQENGDARLTRMLKTAALTWIALNLVLIGTNIYKNVLYINAYGLTHLRIGVYFFLLLAFATLVFCAVKIHQKKNNIFMYRRFGLTLFSLAVLFNCFNWDKIITRHNIDLYKHTNLAPDACFLLDLDPNCLPMIIGNWNILNPDDNAWLNRELDFRCMKFNHQFEMKNWRSQTVNNYATHDALKNYKPLTDYKYNENDYARQFRNPGEF